MSWSYQTKHSGSLTYQDKSGVLAYILTDNSDYVLLGVAENEVLVWSDPEFNWSYQNKS
jgi:hypothetical protein